MAGRRLEQTYQLPFDFSAQPESEPIPSIYRIEPGTLAQLDRREAELGRFVRAVETETFMNTPQDVATFLLEQIYAPFDRFEQEELVTLMLNTQKGITHTAMIYRGTINTVYIRSAEIFRPAVRLNAASIVLAHNHPSGDPTPSPEDVRFTESCVEAGRILDIKLLDHIIVGKDRWVSLKERRLGFQT